MAFGLPRKGTWRLQVLLAAASIVTLISLLMIVLVLNGPPYWRGWWFVLAALALGSIPASIVLSQLVEWVIAGYRTE
jgi:hypothetical protein